MLKELPQTAPQMRFKAEKLRGVFANKTSLEFFCSQVGERTLSCCTSFSMSVEMIQSHRASNQYLSSKRIGGSRRQVQLTSGVKGKHKSASRASLGSTAFPPKRKQFCFDVGNLWLKSTFLSSQSRPPSRKCMCRHIYQKNTTSVFVPCCIWTENTSRHFWAFRGKKWITATLVPKIVWNGISVVGGFGYFRLKINKINKSL